MINFFIKKLSLSILFAFFLGACQFVSNEKVNPAKISDINLNCMLATYYQAEQLDKTTDRSDSKYQYYTHDLNQDGIMDYIVVLASTYFCGTGGCNALIIDGKNKAVLSELSLVSTPLYYVESKGKTILAHTQSGGGHAKQLVFGAIDFNTKRYTKLDNPPMGKQFPILENHSPQFFLDCTK